VIRLQSFSIVKGLKSALIREPLSYRLGTQIGAATSDGFGRASMISIFPFL
jgi:hypothetical protein